jgi:hypothetical protein
MTQTNTAHFLIPVEKGAQLRPSKIVSDVTSPNPFEWFGHTVNPDEYQTWLHYFLQAENETELDTLVEEEIVKLDNIESPYYMIYMDGK